MTDQQTPDTGDIWQDDRSGGPRPARQMARSRAPRSGSRVRRRRTTTWLGVAGYGALGLVCLCLAAAAFLLVAAPVDLLRDRLIEQINARSGREMVVAGSTSVSFFPRVTVSLANVSLAAPPDMPGEPTLTIPSLEVEVGYWSLVTGQALAQRVTLYRPIIELSVDAEGRQSWEFARAKPAAREPGAGGRDPQSPAGGNEEQDSVPKAARRAFGKVHVVDGALRYRNARSGAHYELTALTFAATADDVARPLQVEGSAGWRGERVGFSGTASPLSALLAGQPAQLAIKLSASPLEVLYEGTLTVAGGIALEGRTGLKAASLRALGAWLGKASTAEADPGALVASAQLAVAAAKGSLSSLEATVGATSLQGSLGVEMKEGRPHVGGKLQVSDLDLGALLVRPAKRPSAADARDPAPQAAPPTPTAKPRTGRGWRDDPIDLALLRLADADIALSVGRLSYKEINTGPGRLTVELKGGTARIALDAIELYGGRGQGVLTLDATGEVPVAGANLTLTAVSIPPLLGDTLGFEWLDGRGNIALELAGQGLTERQIVETLNGKVNVAIAEGAMIGADIGKIVRNLQQGRLANLAPAPGDRTPFTELAATFDVAGGTATSRDLRLVSAHLNLNGEGTFALGARQMDCEVRAKISGGQPDERGALNVGTVEVPVTIAGPWERPTFGVKGQEQLIDTVKQIGKRLKSRDVQDTLKGLLRGDGEERAKAREKARDLLEKFLKKE